jgi:hypothetical protein
MKQFNSLIASALVSGLIVAGMVGIGVNALTTPGAPVNRVTAQVVGTPSTSASQQFRSRTERSRTKTTTDQAFESTE